MRGFSQSSRRSYDLYLLRASPFGNAATLLLSRNGCSEAPRKNFNRWLNLIPFLVQPSSFSQIRGRATQGHVNDSHLPSKLHRLNCAALQVRRKGGCFNQFFGSSGNDFWSHLHSSVILAEFGRGVRYTNLRSFKKM